MNYLRLEVCSRCTMRVRIDRRQENSHTVAYETNTHETRYKNRRHKSTPFFSDAGFWYVCHANLGPDSSGTRFRRRIEHCSIPSQKASGVHVTEMIIYDWSIITAYVLMCFCCNLITHYEFIVYVALATYVYFRCYEFSFQTHNDSKTVAENRRQKLKSINQSINQSMSYFKVELLW